MIRSIQQGLADDGITVPVTKLCRWFDVPRRTVYYQPVKSPPKVDPVFADPIKAMIEQEPSFGYRTVAHLLGFNKNTVQRIFQIKGCNASFRSRAGRSANVPLVRVPALKPSHLSHKPRMNDGPQTSRGSGQVKMDGPLLRWSWIATRENCSDGICPDPARHRQQRQHSSMP